MTDSTTKPTAERIQSLRTASEILHHDADECLKPIDGVRADQQPSKDDPEYQGTYAVAELFTSIADLIDQIPPPVVAWAITVAEAIIASQEEEDTACRFCGCTENRACLGGCGWATDEQLRELGIEPMEGDVCTACLPIGAELVRVADQKPTFDNTKELAVLLVHKAGPDGLTGAVLHHRMAALGHAPDRATLHSWMARLVPDSAGAPEPEKQVLKIGRKFLSRANQLQPA